MAQCRGRVLALATSGGRPRAWVLPEAMSDCQACAEGRGCGGGLLARALSRRPDPILLDNDCGALPGDAVLLSAAEPALLAASIQVYFMPLAAFLAGAGLARLLDLPEGGIAAAAFGGLGLAWGLLRLKSGRNTSLPIRMRRAGTNGAEACPTGQCSE